MGNRHPKFPEMRLPIDTTDISDPFLILEAVDPKN